MVSTLGVDYLYAVQSHRLYSQPKEPFLNVFILSHQF